MCLLCSCLYYLELVSVEGRGPAGAEGQLHAVHTPPEHQTYHGSGGGGDISYDISTLYIQISNFLEFFTII